MKLIKTVFHVHTDYSPDSNSSLESLVDTATEQGVHCVAVTDHDTIEGAQILAHIARDTALRVIVGEEISTTEGHLIGLFLREPVPSGRSPRRTAESIREQGGLVAVPHPFTRLMDCGMRTGIGGILDLIDLFEVYNSQNVWALPDWRARRFAARHGLPTIVGSDSHVRGSLAASYQWMPAFDDAATFMESIRHAQPVTRRHAPGYYLGAAWRLARYKAGFGVPADFGRSCRNPLRPRLGPSVEPRVSSQSTA